MIFYPGYVKTWLFCTVRWMSRSCLLSSLTKIHKTYHFPENVIFISFKKSNCIWQTHAHNEVHVRYNYMSKLRHNRTILYPFRDICRVHLMQLVDLSLKQTWHNSGVLFPTFLFACNSFKVDFRLYCLRFHARNFNFYALQVSWTKSFCGQFKFSDGWRRAFF